MELSMLAFDSFDGAEICFTDDGEGPATILLHAFIIDSTLNWHETGIAQAIRHSGRRVIVPDFRGHGESAAPHDPAAYANHAMAQDIQMLIDCLELEAVDLVGYSMGSCVAVQVALRDERIRKLVLGGINTGECQPDDPAQRMREVESLREDSPRDPGFYRAFVDEEGADRWAVAARLEGDRFPQFVEADARCINRPVCVINGRDDFEAPDRVAALFPNGESQTCDGDHLSAIWMPSFATSVCDFLNR